MSAGALAGWVAAVAVACGGWARAAVCRERAQRACHELRGAIGTVGLGLELAARGVAIDPIRARAMTLELARARQALEDLSGVVIPGGGGEEVRVAELLSDSVEAWRPAAAGRELRLDLAGCGDARVAGSRARLAQATGNLIANAIEHGAGTVSVSARCGGGQVRIAVSDCGEGLPVPLVKLLERRAWPWACRAHGHGLAIVAEVARSHGGRLEPAPSAGGARLVLVLPLKAGAATGTPAPARAPRT